MWRWIRIRIRAWLEIRTENNHWKSLWFPSLCIGIIPIINRPYIVELLKTIIQPFISILLICFAIIIGLPIIMDTMFHIKMQYREYVYRLAQQEARNPRI